MGTPDQYLEEQVWRPSFVSWLLFKVFFQEDRWMNQTAYYYFEVTEDLRAAYLTNDKRLEWLKELTLDRFKVSAENLRTFTIAIFTSLVSFVVAQLSDKAPPIPLELNATALGLSLFATFLLALYHEYIKVHLGARVNGICGLVETAAEAGAE